jgi:hypothetical protein
MPFEVKLRGNVSQVQSRQQQSLTSLSALGCAGRQALAGSKTSSTSRIAALLSRTCGRRYAIWEQELDDRRQFHAH